MPVFICYSKYSKGREIMKIIMYAFAVILTLGVVSIPGV